MSLSRLLGFFTRSARRAAASVTASDSEAEHFFALRHHSFKLFLTAWNTFQETMTALEYTLCCDHPFGLYRVRALCTSMATQVFQCVKQLERLDPAPCQALYARFAELQKNVADDVYEPEVCLLGPLVLPLGEDSDLEALSGQGGFPLVDPATLRLEEVRRRHPQLAPRGFAITMAGCQHFLQSNDLQSEINRRIQAAGGLAPKHLAKLSRGLGQLVEDTPLPPDLEQEIRAALARLRASSQHESMRLVLRGRLWPPEARGSDDPGLILWGPSVPLDASDEEILHAVQLTLARKQRAQALVYRRARGLTDAGAGVCITCMAVEEGSWGGLAHSCSPVRAHGELVHVYACQGLPQELDYSVLPADHATVDRQPPHEIVSLAGPDDAPCLVLDADTARDVAALALELEELLGCPVSLSWVRTPQGELRLLLVRPIPLPVDAVDMPPVLPEVGPNLRLSGGYTVSPGRVAGPVCVARRWEDARRFPPGGILVVPDDNYRWGALMDRVAGIIAKEGLAGSRLASLAREFGKPAIFGMAGALDTLENGQSITLCSDICQVYADRQESLLPNVPPGRDYMPGSPVYRILQKASARILPLTMDVDSPEFKAANCQTYHDIARYCHERAVSAMFSLGAEKKYAPQRVKQLRDKVLKQFWVVNLSDGFAVTPSGPVIDIDQIASVPMRALWRGMNAYPWQGPPPVDGKGFLSVLFEATANPNLDPAAQTAYFSEKNYFMISRDYCSLHSRFGFHFVSVEARLGERTPENYLTFHLRGGAANIERRILRVRFVSEILWEFGFAPTVRNDAVSATLKGMDREEGELLLAIAGYMTIHTRQLDMIMQDAAQVAARREEMLNHCRMLFRGESLAQDAPGVEEKQACP
ncbi:PEP/pyruvate-binding domain-containing protein [Desulfovibrio sp. 86]|uniref:Phosphoenolpyruvate synthase n=1 Tax=uncultured Desulfovibrio sp. TaxID=167968 RepID=A0A212LAW6_9BACT|nr:PEP/pyruvate-binding domain-containing protein [Desulfovibrio sp. 86]SCM74724.1 Pyruvate phosphate dikinase PEP/pyruvate-binding [uncultured Desulfovibrio sp.]VZH35009.1 Pyruvate phosphate dikinase PEP/pyruvate-binding [Desulfovibrio sp. 86]